MGKKLKLKPIHPALINRLSSGIAWPERPTYDREIVGGEIEKLPHNETTLETPEEFEAWEKYIAATSAAEESYFRRKVKLYIAHGVETELPEGCDLVQYVEDECIGTMTDVLAIVKGIDKLSTIDVEALAEVERIFRDQMEGITA